MTYLTPKVGNTSGTAKTREKHFLRLVKQAKLCSYHNAPKYKFGYQIPRDYEEAMKFDELNHHNKWDQSVKAGRDETVR
jgi:hypothetical protein